MFKAPHLRGRAPETYSVVWLSSEFCLQEAEYRPKRTLQVLRYYCSNHVSLYCTRDRDRIKNPICHVKIFWSMRKEDPFFSFFFFWDANIVQTIIKRIFLPVAWLCLMEMRLDRYQSGGSLSNPRWSLTSYITWGNNITFLCFCLFLFVLSVWNGRF